MTVRNTLIIGALGEVPYAESEGDRNIPYCLNLVDDPLGCLYDSNLNPYIPSTQAKTLQLDYETFDTNVINSIREVDKSIPLVTVLFSGRPMLVDSALNISSAFIAAWLPGTAGGQGVIDAIAGDYKLRPNGDADKTNTLSMDWPANMVHSHAILRIHLRLSQSTIQMEASQASPTLSSKWATVCHQWSPQSLSLPAAQSLRCTANDRSK